MQSACPQNLVINKYIWLKLYGIVLANLWLAIGQGLAPLIWNDLQDLETIKLTQ